MEPRPNPLLTYVGLAAASATAARHRSILAKKETVPGCCGFSPAGTNNHIALWTTTQFNGLGMVKLFSSGSTATQYGSKALRWAASASGSYSGHWFLAQAPDPDDEGQEEPEDEEETKAEPQRRNAPAVRKPSSTEENTEQLREGGTINPPFP